ncbi:MAG: hypothetical protein IJ939_05100 [Clostridia bacterium]|nr:hypothetical protein [Clostridia bacterium]
MKSIKSTFTLLAALILILCSCSFGGNDGTSSLSEKSDKSIVGKWIDVSTEQTVEYTESGFYYEYINENFTADKTRYMTQDGKIYYYLDGDEPDMELGIDYEIKDGHLFIAGVIEYRPMDIKTSAEEME